jgi:hypothetical protein
MLRKPNAAPEFTSHLTHQQIMQLYGVDCNGMIALLITNPAIS